MLVETIFPTVSKMFENLIQLERDPFLNLTKLTQCHIYNIEHIEAVDAHVVITFGWNNDKDSKAVISTSQCYALSKNKRVIVGASLINLK